MVPRNMVSTKRDRISRIRVILAAAIQRDSNNYGFRIYKKRPSSAWFQGCSHNSQRHRGGTSRGAAGKARSSHLDIRGKNGQFKTAGSCPEGIPNGERALP